VLDGKQFDGDRFEIPYAELFGSHALQPQGSNDRAIYIVRDGRDVALSLWAWKGMRTKESENASFSEYIRTKIDWQGAPGARARPTETLFEHWVRHVENYRSSGFFIVRYEDLCLDPELVLKSVAERFDLVPAVELDTAEERVGWNPGSGGVMKWQRELGKEELELFDSIVPRGFIGRYEPS
jgi:bile-salt sulfotransferase